MSELDRRVRILGLPAAEGISVREACRGSGISPTTFYDWKRRLEGGVLALQPRSRRPWSSPTRIDALIEERICGLRDEHPRWGPVRIHGELMRAGVTPPSVSTIKRVLDRNGFIARVQRRASPPPIRFERAAPNELWQTDATEVMLADDTKAAVLNVLDDCARMLLSCRAAVTADTNSAWAAMNAAITRFGPPREVLSDNGSYFTGRFHGGVAVFERRLWAQGIATTHSRPGHPQTCGKQERFHFTQKQWLAEHGPFRNLAELQAGLDAFAEHYNHERPHQGIGNIVPADRFRTLERTGPQPELVQQRVSHRGVDQVGKIRYAGWQIHLGSRLAGQQIEIIDDGAKIRVLHHDEQLHVFAATEPKGYLSTGQPHNPTA